MDEYIIIMIIIKNKIIGRVFTRAFSTINPQQPINYYQLFNLPIGFTEQQLKSSYLQLVKKYHPDLTKQPNATQIFRQVQQGYSILSNSATRLQYQSSQTKTKQQQTNSSIVNQMRQKYFKSYPRKDPINDEFNFSYNMFKEHYQKVESPKKEYHKYEGQGDEYYAKKDEQGEKLWIQVGGGLAAIGVVAAAYFYTRS